jgi:DNA-binding NarL/FixJ family response regulator
MQSFLFADAVSVALKREQSDFDVYKAENPEAVADINRWLLPYALLMEVTGSPPWTLEERLKLRDEVKQHNPNCKIVLAVDENSAEDVARAVRQAKKDRVIDQFIYGSISASYLCAIMDAL